MKSKFALLASALGLFAVAPVWAGSINFDFSSCASIVSTASQCPGDLGTAQAVYTDSTGTYGVVAYGVDYSLSPIDLFVKDDGGSENGLGLAGTVDNEINNSDTGQGIVLDMADLAANGMDSGTVTFGSLQSGESGAACNLASPEACQQVVQSGNTGMGSATVTWSTTDPYLLFWQPLQDGGNFLVSSLSVQTNSVPEPGSALLFVAGLAGLALAIVRRKRAFER